MKKRQLALMLPLEGIFLFLPIKSGNASSLSQGLSSGVFSDDGNRGMKEIRSRQGIGVG